MLYMLGFYDRVSSAFKQISYINKADQLKEVIDQQVQSELLPRWILHSSKEDVGRNLPVSILTLRNRSQLIYGNKKMKSK